MLTKAIINGPLNNNVETQCIASLQKKNARVLRAFFIKGAIDDYYAS